jgi:hypothetical protein
MLKEILEIDDRRLVNAWSGELGDDGYCSIDLSVA